MIRISVLLFTLSLASAALVLPRIKTTVKSYGLVWIQGASCTAESYIPVLEEIQKQFPYSLWVSVPDFVLHTPQPLQIAGKVEEALESMQAAGLPAGSPIFHGGHSLGSVMIQDYLKNNTHVASLGLILHGGFIQRKYVTLLDSGKYNVGLSIPVATIAGELDGLARVTRMAEAYYYQIMNSDTDASRFPVTVIKGVSHAQFISGETPYFVEINDLLPEVTLEVAHTNIAKASVAFMNQVLKTELYHQDEYTTTLLAPMIEALLLEGYNNFKPPCYGHDIINDQIPTCQHGSDWTEVAQVSLCGLSDTLVSVKPDSNYHRVESVTPVHLPTITNTCDGYSKCTLNTIVVVEAAYDSLLSLDTGLQMISASELKTKLVSRERAWHLGGKASVAKFDETDGPSLCAEANQKAIDWALAHLPKETVARYLKYGQLMRVGEDLGPYNAGPLWIWTYMSYIEESVNGQDYLTIKAPMMKTPLNYLISSAAGFHYCKVLSPARTAEWMMVDGLKKNRSLKSILVSS